MGSFISLWFALIMKDIRQTFNIVLDPLNMKHALDTTFCIIPRPGFASTLTYTMLPSQFLTVPSPSPGRLCNFLNGHWASSTFSKLRQMFAGSRHQLPTKCFAAVWRVKFAKNVCWTTVSELHISTPAYKQEQTVRCSSRLKLPCSCHSENFHL